MYPTSPSSSRIFASSSLTKKKAKLSNWSGPNLPSQLHFHYSSPLIISSSPTRLLPFPPLNPLVSFFLCANNTVWEKVKNSIFIVRQTEVQILVLSLTRYGNLGKVPHYVNLTTLSFLLQSRNNTTSLH